MLEVNQFQLMAMIKQHVEFQKRAIEIAKGKTHRQKEFIAVVMKIEIEEFSLEMSRTLDNSIGEIPF
jgi:uncharacterized protein YggU (UPF0235/DUF167 family)